MRVLHIDTGTHLRGGQYQVMHLIRGLEREGHESLLLAPAESPLHDLGIRAARLTPQALMRAAARHDLIHAHDSRAHSWATLSSGLLVVSRRVAFRRQLNFFSRWKYRQAHRFLAISGHIAGLLEEEGVARERIALVADGVPMLPATEAIPNLVVALASRDPLKHNALAEKAARRAGVPLHFSHDLEQDLPHASIFLYLSEQEGLGSAALLAQSAGVPVIASRIGGLTEAVEDNVTGLLVENRVEEIAAALVALLKDPVRTRLLGAAGRLRAQQQFSIPRLVERTLEEYRFTLKCFGRKS
ncbi:MAG: glycosyltransferase family 4 protein [Bryobacteraceae bacterium]|nr:glycosyltransferase family 4 protein [Bryobacteraceae bacterium]